MSTVPGNKVIRIGCAGWNIPREHAGNFPAAGTHLQRYGNILSAAEINSSFYRPHRNTTYARWAHSVPEYFRFSVKIPKLITHERRLVNAADQVSAFVEQIAGLGKCLGCLLVQLPPSLKFDVKIADEFFRNLRGCYSGSVVCEPRHATWFSASADELLQQHRSARVAADPAPHPAAAQPAGHSRVKYFRLHGSPTMYYSPYTSEYLAALAATLTAYCEQGDDVWCIFDNTAGGAPRRMLSNCKRCCRRASKTTMWL